MKSQEALQDPLPGVGFDLRPPGLWPPPLPDKREGPHKATVLAGGCKRRANYAALWPSGEFWGIISQVKQLHWTKRDEKSGNEQ